MDALHRTASKRAQVFLCHRVWLQYPLGESPQILDEIAIESLLSFQRAGCTQLVWSNVPREISNELAARDLKSVTCLPAAGCLIKEARLMHLLTRDTPIQHVKDILVMAAVARYGGIFSDFKVILKSPVSLAFICPDQTYIATEPCKQYGRQTNRCFRVSHLIPGSRTLAPHPVGSGASRALASPPVGSGAETGAGSDTRGKPRSSPSEGVALAQVWLGWGYAPIGAPLIAEFVDKSSEFWGARAARIQSGQTTAEANWGMSKLWMHNTQLLHDLVLKHSATLLEPLYFVALPPFLDSVSKMGSVAYNYYIPTLQELCDCPDVKGVTLWRERVWSKPGVRDAVFSAVSEAFRPRLNSCPAGFQNSVKDACKTLFAVVAQVAGETVAHDIYAWLSAWTAQDDILGRAASNDPRLVSLALLMNAWAVVVKPPGTGDVLRLASVFFADSSWLLDERAITTLSHRFLNII